MFCLVFSYMGIGLSAQGVNMNRLPGKAILQVSIQSVGALSFAVCVCVSVCLRYSYKTPVSRPVLCCFLWGVSLETRRTLWP